jgi:molybdopterin-containing oxidoreductase family membrane subunit
MKRIIYDVIRCKSPKFLAFLGALMAVVAVGLAAVYHMEHEGHYVTGMSNQIVWGLPHVFAIFLIVAASGALNIASIGSVFSKTMYKPLGRLSGFLSIALLVGGLMILVLDLGRPDRLIVAMTTYNFKSIFAWNIFLYNGFIVIVGVYLWFMMERKMAKYSSYAGVVAFLWRLILTTGTGSIFGFLVARQAYDAALLAPMFIVMSFAIGLAVFILVLVTTYRCVGWPLGNSMLAHLNKLLGLFVAALLYFTLVYHATNLYVTENHALEHFLLVSGGIYPMLFWGGHVLVGSLLPLFFIYHPMFNKDSSGVIMASIMVIIGAFALLYFFIIGGQAFPLQMFSDYEVIESSFFDGRAIHPYVPSIWELLLGLAGIAVALLVTVFGMMSLPFLAVSLADEHIDPFHLFEVESKIKQEQAAHPDAL